MNLSGNLQTNVSPLPPSQAKPAPRPEEEVKKPNDRKTETPVIRWELVNGNVIGLPNISQVDFTTVTTHEELIQLPKYLTIFGSRIDLTSKIEFFKDQYTKNINLSKSHNLLVSRFAEFKVAFYGTILSLLGVSPQEMITLQAQAREAALKENRVLLEENIFNEELIGIVGGSRRTIRGQLTVINELNKQFFVQAERWGKSYTQEEIVNIKINQCQKILDNLNKEKANLDYQLAYYFGA